MILFVVNPKSLKYVIGHVQPVVQFKWVVIGSGENQYVFTVRFVVVKPGLKSGGRVTFGKNELETVFSYGAFFTSINIRR